MRFRDLELREKLYGEVNAKCLNTSDTGFVGQTVDRLNKLARRLFGESNGSCMNLETSDGGRGLIGEAMNRIEKLEEEVTRLKNRRPSSRARSISSRSRPKRKK